MAEPTARARLERAMHVSFKLPAEVASLLDEHEAEHRGQVLAEAADLLRAHCPRHGTAETTFVACHCPAADELTRTAPDAP